MRFVILEAGSVHGASGTAYGSGSKTPSSVSEGAANGSSTTCISMADFNLWGFRMLGWGKEGLKLAWELQEQVSHIVTEPSIHKVPSITGGSQIQSNGHFRVTASCLSFLLGCKGIPVVLRGVLL